MFSIDSVVELFNQYNNIAVLISLLISVGIALSGVIPSVFVTGANILFFGPINGFLISLLGETIGGYITFKIYRLGFKKKAEFISDKHKLLDKLVNSDGKRSGMLIFEGRLIPFIPAGFVTLAASLSNVGGVRFTIATFLGKIPSIALEALVSYDIINISENYIRLGITLISLLLLWFTIRRKK